MTHARDPHLGESHDDSLNLAALDWDQLEHLLGEGTPLPWEPFQAAGGWVGVTTDMRPTEESRAGDVFSSRDCTVADAKLIAAAVSALGQMVRMAKATELPTDREDGAR